MKKTLIAIAALAAALVGCTQLGEDQIVVNNDKILGDPFYGYIDEETRTLIDSENKLNWEADDLITVFNESDHNLQYKVVLEDGAESARAAKFAYTEVYVEGSGVEFDQNYAIVPYGDENVISGSVLSFPMPALVEGAVNNADNIPLVASSATHDFYFKMPAAVMRIKVSKENNPNKFVLKTITITSRKGQKLAGTAQVDMAAEVPTATIVDDENASSSVTLDLGEGLVLTTEQQFVYFAVPAMTFETDDLAISFTAVVSKDEKSGVVNKAPSIKFEAGKLKQTSLLITSDLFSGSTEDATPVANVAGVEYKTLEEAFTAAIELGGEQTISMTASAVVNSPITVPAENNITLILNGNTASYAKDTMGEAMITNKGTLTILGGTIDYNYTGVADTAYSKGNYTINNVGTLVVGEGAVVKNSTQALSHACYAIDNNSINSVATLTINGGQVINTNNYAVRQIGGKNKNTVTVNSGKIEGTRAIWIQLPGSNTADAPEMELTVKDGELIGTKVDSSDNQLAIYSYSYGNDMKNVKINIEGGDFTGDVALTGGKNKTNIETLTISGGSFVGRWGEVYSYGDEAKAVEAITISGGSFKTNTEVNKFLVDNLKTAWNETTEMYDVVPNVVANVNGTDYLTMQDAIDATPAGETLTLIGEPTEDEVILIGKDITIDGTKLASASLKRMGLAKSATVPTTITSSASRIIRITEGGVKVKLVNLNLVSTATREGTNDIRGISVDNVKNVELTLDNVSVSFDPAYGTDWAYGVNLSGTDSESHTININGGYYEGANNINVWGKNHIVNVNGATLANTYVTGQFVGVGVKLNGTGAVATIDNVTFTGDTGALLWDEHSDEAYFGKNTITVDGVRQVNADAQLEAALKNWDVENVKINILKDVNFQVGNPVKVGGASTKEVNIEGNNNKLTLATTYWSHIGTTNDDAKLVFNNITLTSSQTSGTWDSYDLAINSNAELNNVKVLKALALDGANKEFVLNDVTITESHDYYAIWIAANGAKVAIDGLTIESAGRGIKIDDQYCNESTAFVELDIKNATFTTAKKAAIMVKTSKGAKITAENLDITKVAADDYHAVWCDEDAAAYYDLIEVEGCYMLLEGDTRIADGLILKANGEYWLYSAEGLKYIRDEVNATVPYSNESEFEGKTVKQMNDINLGGEEWIPIGDDRSQRTEWHGIFDGQDFAIKNFKITQKTARDDENKSSYGLFGNVKGTVKNLTVSNAQVSTPSGVKFVAALVGRLNGGLVENCKVVDSSVKAQGWTVGALIAQYNDGEVKGCSVENTTVEAPTVGGIIGLALNAGDRVIENCSVKDSKFINTKAYGGAYDAMIAPIVGGIYSGALNVTLNGCSTSNNTENGVAVGNTFEDFVGYISDGDKLTVDGKEYVAEGVWSWDNATQLTNLTGLKWLANEVNVNSNTFSKKTVKLVNDINLGSEEWTPIGNASVNFQGTFDGNNKTISNLVITTGNDYVGLFGCTSNGEIKNLTVNNAKVKGRVGTGVVAGSPYTSKFNNIKVTGLVQVDGMAYVGGVGGRNAYASWKDITVDAEAGSYVHANSVENGLAYRSYVGGIIGFTGEGPKTFENMTSNIDVKGSTIDVGGLVGIAHYQTEYINCHVSGNVEVYGAEAAVDAEETGGLAGVWMNNATYGPVKFIGCSFTGTLKANQAADLSDNTITGNGYNYTGVEGNGYRDIDGTKHYFLADGVWKDITNAAVVYELKSKDALYWFANKVNVNHYRFSGETVKLMKDVDLEGETWIPVGLESYNNNFIGTFDGNGKIVSNFVCDDDTAAGFFGRTSGGAYIKNLTVADATITSRHYAGGIMAWAETGGKSNTIENCHVLNSTITSTVVNNDNGDKVGGIIGWMYYGNVLNCSVKETYLSGYRDMGGIMGYTKGGTVTGNSIENVTINVDNSVNYKNYGAQKQYNVGSIIGRIDGAPTEANNTGEATIKWNGILANGSGFGAEVGGDDLDW